MEKLELLKGQTRPPLNHTGMGVINSTEQQQTMDAHFQAANTIVRRCDHKQLQSRKINNNSKYKTKWPPEKPTDDRFNCCLCVFAIYLLCKHYLV